ncbi:class I SAM-dependent methyltransferase [Ramlibacter pallidus]|uniref:Methyltransferase domain-containing protein n=1 Tax=Ramlibacter pallidus TaxID=2780087 RepID=A0ABR9RXL9_9BURK|nr:methyltransferase domain-containing protein [Ramlibacter pallidus]MBE7365985.1 methyltransferase domain-containing protein [Ramlibacter pallidus]
MPAPDSDRKFAGSIPQLYEQYLVPLIFQPYAVDLAARVARQQPLRVLEIAAGTGVVTRQLAQVLPRDSTIVATDLNQPMLDEAAARGTARAVEWKAADAMQLPFADQSFDAVVCQFGVMFFPEKAKAFAEARRVLRDGGSLFFNAWDRIEVNEVSDTVTQSLALVFPSDPPRFLARVPHGYHDVDRIARDLAEGGFTQVPEIATVAERSRADGAYPAAFAKCQGTPLRNEIEARDPNGLERATQAAAAALTRRFGTGPIDGRIQAHVVEARR